MLRKSKIDNFEFTKVDNLLNWEKSPNKNNINYSSETITKDPWILVSKQERELLDRLEQSATKRLGDPEISEIFVGLQTSADDIYIFNPLDVSDVEIKFEDIDGKVRKIERGICKEAILDQSIHYFENLNDNRYIIFPYYEVEGQHVLIQEDKLKKEFPKAYAYLSAFRQVKRRDLGSQNALWYQYGRSQSLNKFNTVKLVIKNPSSFTCAVYDDKNIKFTGGGNGPYYGIRPTNSFSIYSLLAFINNILFDKWVKSRSSVFRGGYYSFGKQFISNFPLPNLDSQSKKQILQEIEELWKRIINLNIESKPNTPQQAEEINKEKQLLKSKADQKVVSLYDIPLETVVEVENEDN